MFVTCVHLSRKSWPNRALSGSPEKYLHREPICADELDRQVIHGTKDFGSKPWEQKRRFNFSLAISFISEDGTSYSSRTTKPPTPSKKSKRFSGFDFYHRKLFALSTSPSSSNNTFSSSSSPPQSQAQLITPGGALVDAKEKPLDPTKGVHPVISMYFLAREKMERKQVYGPGAFASSQLSVADAGHGRGHVNGTANGVYSDTPPSNCPNGVPPPVPEHFSAPGPAVPTLASPTGAKADYSMPRNLSLFRNVLRCDQYNRSHTFTPHTLVPVSISWTTTSCP